MNHRTVIVAALLLSSLSSEAQNNFDTVQIRPLQVANQIYMLTGAGGNIGVMTGKDGTLMIDDQFAPLSNKINGAIKTLDPGEIRFLVNTHLHGDHSGGNENFKKMGVTVVAQEHVRTRMSKETVNRTTQQTTPPRDHDAWPVITFPDRMQFHLNEEDIELMHFDPAHTDGDVVVHFKNADVYHMGDMFVTYGYPFIDYNNGGSISGFISSLDKVLATMSDQAKIIPGHGPVSTKAEIKVFRDRLADIRDQVAAALKKGKKVEDITALPIATKYDSEWGKGFVKGKDFVLNVATELTTAVK
jgi:glyoxylase-like metal-dependent hydrolase (beta-lactamase superfamily II)